MRRFIKIKNFKNIGVNDQQKLTLSSSVKRGELGGLVILIGENNLGKSNVINGIKKYCMNQLNINEDRYDNYFENDLVPEITLCSREGLNEFYHDKNTNIQSSEDGYHYNIEKTNKELIELN